MQITNDSFNGTKVVFESIIDEVPGGASIPVTRLNNTTHDANVDKRYLPAGTPVYYVPATRIAEVCKTALGITGGGATTPRVGKNHHFKVGEILHDGVTGAVIQSVTEGTAYDTLGVSGALLFAAGTKFLEGSASGTNTTLLYSPNGVTKNDIFIGDGNADAPIVRIGTVREDALENSMPTLYKTALRSATGTSLITFV